MTTVNTTSSSGPYIAVAQTTFAVTFQSISTNDIRVTKDGSLVGVGYTFNRNDDGKGDVVFNTPQTGQIEIFSDPDFQMETEFQRFGAFYPDQINPALDQLARQDIVLAGRVGVSEADIAALEMQDAIHTSAISAAAAADAAILAAIANAGGDLGTVILQVANRTILAALDTSLGLAAQLLEGLRGGLFEQVAYADWAADFDAEATAGTTNIFIRSTYDPTKGWRRPFERIDITDFMFGAGDDKDTLVSQDNANAIEAWANFVWLHACYSGSCISKGTLSRGITVGTGTRKTTNLHFGPHIRATAAMDFMVTLTSVSRATIDFTGFEMRGSNSFATRVPLVDRLAKYGLRIHDYGRANGIGTIRAWNLYYFAVYCESNVGTYSQNYGRLPYIEAIACGSAATSDTVIVDSGGVFAYKLTANWNAPVRLGVADSFNQTTTINVSAIPLDNPVRGYDASQKVGVHRLVRISGHLYRFTSTIEPSGDPAFPWTLTLGQPWLGDVPFTAGSGTLEYSFGGGLALHGGNTSRLQVEGVNGETIGFVVIDQALHGSQINHIGTGDAVDVYYAFGTGPNSASRGGTVLGGYIEFEKPTIEVLDFSMEGSAAVQIGQISGRAFDFTKWIKHSPYSTGNRRAKQGLDAIVSVGGHEGKQLIAYQGHTFTVAWDPPSIAANTSASTTLQIEGVSLEYLKGRNLRVRFDQGLGQIIATAAATSTNAGGDLTTVTITFFNPTGAAIDLASGIVSVTIMRN